MFEPNDQLQASPLWQGNRRRFLTVSAMTLVAAGLPAMAMAAAASEIDQKVVLALETLYKTEPKAKELGAKAKAILVFPQIVKGGLIVGGETGDGALRADGKSVGYYNISALSFGLQAGAQVYGYALFFMTTEALSYLDKSDGWAIGTGPSVVVLDKGAAASITSTTITQDVYAIPFGEQGLMAGVSLEGSKITKITPN